MKYIYILGVDTEIKKKRKKWVKLDETNLLLCIKKSKFSSSFTYMCSPCKDIINIMQNFNQFLLRILIVILTLPIGNLSFHTRVSVCELCAQF